MRVARIHVSTRLCTCRVCARNSTRRQLALFPVEDVTCFSWIALKRRGEVWFLATRDRRSWDRGSIVIQRQVLLYVSPVAKSSRVDDTRCKDAPSYGHDVVISRHDLVPRIESLRRAPVSPPCLPFSLPLCLLFVPHANRTRVNAYFRNSSSSKLNVYGNNLWV